jgi:hypothetical protein
MAVALTLTWQTARTRSPEFLTDGSAIWLGFRPAGGEVQEGALE